ncbi:MAG: ABC transporter permease [Candidatus Symbiothrix sp.]|jgi:ABC-2 type transport system permease protein|nr:ABC transporter permease [Candidatus Symbiothrix sp.]
MNKTGIVIHREYTTRIRKPSFVVITLLMPVLFLAIVWGSMMMSPTDATSLPVATMTADLPSLQADVDTALGMIFTFLIYIFIMVYGAMVMQGVMEEKTNRIIEVMISSVRPFDLLLGKIIGISLVGLTQFVVWGAFFTLGFLLLSSSESWQFILALMLAISNIGEILLFFVAFFIGGYLLYASLFASIGAVTNSHEDTQQFLMPVTLIILFAFYVGMYSAQHPDGTLALWASLIPFTSPIVMMTRIAYGLPAWQWILSLVLLYAADGLMIGAAAKIYRTGILMYGKKPSLKEIIKWLKY